MGVVDQPVQPAKDFPGHVDGGRRNCLVADIAQDEPDVLPEIPLEGFPGIAIDINRNNFGAASH